MVKKVIKIIKFIKNTLKTQGFKKAIIALSGGLDSSTALLLLTKALGPENIICLKLPYGKQDMSLADLIIKTAGIPKNNVKEINIKKIVSLISQYLNISISDKIRLGNILSRVRMILLYDLAKSLNALVCGTENKTEYLLGYYTRFGDEASDFEPLRHLYKTEVKKLAKHLGAPQKIINQSPTAGFWPSQTDEGEFGFTYKEADQVLYLYLEKKLSREEISKQGFPNARKIISRLQANSFKHQTPYFLTFSYHGRGEKCKVFRGRQPFFLPLLPANQKVITPWASKDHLE